LLKNSSTLQVRSGLFLDSLWKICYDPLH